MKKIHGWWVPTYPGQPDQCVDNICVNAVLLDQPWEPQVMKAAALAQRTGQLVIEIGASYGLHTRVLARQTEVLALEPQHVAFACLVANTIDVPHAVTCLNLAGYDDHRRMILAETQADPHVAQQPGHPSATLLPAIGTGWYAAPVDQLVRALYGPVLLPNVCLIKVDAQGADYPGLRGCTETITRCAPTLIFEYEGEMAKMHRWAFTELRHWLQETCAGTLYCIDGLNYLFDTDDRLGDQTGAWEVVAG